MKKSLKQTLLCVLSSVLCFSLLFCPDFSITSSAADKYSIPIPAGKYYADSNLIAYAFAGNEGAFENIPLNGNTFSSSVSDSGLPTVFFNLSAYPQYTACDVLCGFVMHSNFEGFPLSDSSFNFSATLESYFASGNRPDEVAIAVTSVSSFSEIFSTQIDSNGFYKLSQSSIIETFRTCYENPTSSLAPVYGFVSSKSLINNGYSELNCYVNVPVISEDLIVLFMSHKKNGNNFFYLPNTCYLTPTGKTLTAYKEYIQQQEIISQNQQQIEQNSEQISQNDVIIGSDEEGKESGVKGLLKKLKELPQTIGEKLKELFVPTDEQLESFQTNMKSLLSEHLGAVYQSGEIITNIFKKLKDFSPYQSDKAADYDVKIKAHDFYVNVEDESNIFSETDNGGSKFSLIPVGSDGYYHIDFSFLDAKPYKQLYSLYRACVTVLFILLAVNLFKRKYDSLMGGDVY